MDTQFPSDRVTPITDDAEAQAIMLKYDVLDQVARKTHIRVLPVLSIITLRIGSCAAASGAILIRLKTALS